MNITRAPLHAIAVLMLAAITARAELVNDFVTATNSAATNTFSGRVGIGTNNPATLLDVNGSTIIRGNLIASNGLTVSGPFSGITAAQVGAVSTTDSIYLAALTNAAQFASAAQGALAGTALQPNGSGANLTGITAAQVGAVATNNARYLAALTNIPAGAIGAAQLAAGAVTIGKLDLAKLDLRYVLSTNASVRIANNQPNAILGTNVLCIGSLAVGSNLFVNGMISGNGVGITNVSVDASLITTGTLSKSIGGVWNAANLTLLPVGDISMGSFATMKAPATTASMPGYRYYRFVMNAVDSNPQGMMLLDELQFKIGGAWLTNSMGGFWGYTPAVSASTVWGPDCSDYAAGKVFDGVTGSGPDSSYKSFWSSWWNVGMPQWIKIDFKANVQITGMKVTGFVLGQYTPTAFALQGSNDDNAWSEIIGSARTGVHNLNSTLTCEWTWLN